MNRSLLSAAALTVAALFSATASAQTIGCEVGVANGGLIPASGTGGGGTYPTVLPTSISTFPLNVAAIPPGATCVTEVKFTGLAHTWTDDVHVVLQDPTGAMTNLMVRPAGSGDFLVANTYSIVEAAATCTAWPTAGNIASGAYPQNFGETGQTWPSGSLGMFNNDISTIPAQTGLWNLICFDWVAADSGAVASWDVCFGTPTPPQIPCSVPVLTSPANGANVNGPNVSLVWNAVVGATSYDVDVDGVVTNVAASPFAYVSAIGMHTWTVRAVNAAGVTAYATPRTFNDVGPAPPVLVYPANLAQVNGPNVSLMWTPPAGASGFDIDVDGVVTALPGSAAVFNYASTAGPHTWTVRVKYNGNTVLSAYATPRTFTDLGAPTGSCNGTNLPTFFASNNNGSLGGIIYFDVNVTNPAGINLAQLDTNTGTLVAGTPFSMDVYTKAGTSVGFESNQAAWTLMANGAGTAAGANKPSVVEFADFMVPPGVSGVALVMFGASHFYTNGTTGGANQLFSNADLSISLGKANNVPWAASPFSPRVWNGNIRYNCGGAPPVSYCTAGTSTNGCAATITADNNPSVSQANPCNLTVSNVEGQKSGLIFYGLTQAAIPWSPGSTSFLCVKSPTQRTPTQSSNGTAGLCDGSLVLDLNAYLTGNPGSLGQPFAAGNKIYGQAWYRDPPAPKTTNLSDGVELTFQP